MVDSFSSVRLPARTHHVTPSTCRCLPERTMHPHVGPRHAHVGTYLPARTPHVGPRHVQAGKRNQIGHPRTRNLIETHRLASRPLDSRIERAVCCRFCKPCDFTKYAWINWLSCAYNPKLNVEGSEAVVSDTLLVPGWIWPPLMGSGRSFHVLYCWAVRPPSSPTALRRLPSPSVALHRLPSPRPDRAHARDQDA